MAALAKLVRRFPPDELGKPPGKRTKWFWILRWTTTDGDRGQAESIGFWSKDPTWRPARGARVRMNRSDAEKLLRSKLVECDKGKQDKPPSTPWDEWVESYLEATRGTVADSTLAEIQCALRLFGETCEPRCPRDVNRVMVKRFVAAQRREDGYKGGKKSDGTIRKHLSSLRRVWNDVDSLAESNPFASIRIKVPKKDWHRYTRAEIDSLITNALDDFWKSMIAIGYTTGLRRGELLNLTWTDIDFDGMCIKVQPKADTKTTWGWTPKDKDRRTVPLTSDAFVRLKSLERRASEANPYVLLAPSRYVRIQSRRSGGQWKPTRHTLNNFNRTWKSVCENAKVPACEFHSLRKTCITNWLEAGVPPHRVQALAGHSDIKTTISYYSKMDTQDTLNQARKVSENIGIAASA